MIFMTLYDFTDKKFVQVFATQSRRADLSGYELAQVHIELGKYLASHIIEEFSLEDIQIQHPQGMKVGKRISHEEEIILIVFLRSGIYMAEGFRSVFKLSPCHYVNPVKDSGLDEKELHMVSDINGKEIIIIDSVINTGKTLIPVMNQLLNYHCKKIFVSTLVMPKDTADTLKTNFPTIDFYVARISMNSYIGKGKTDTGNRLFNTFSI